MRRAAARAAALLAALLALPAAAGAQERPRVGAPSAVVVEATTGAVAYSRDARRRVPVGSTVKMMTAIIARDRLGLEDVVPASDYRPAPVESQIGLRPGERLRVRDLLRGLLLASGNDAAMALAEAASGTEAAFVAEMNRRARRLGLRDTRFTNPIGLDEGGARSSARDLALLALELRRDAYLRRIVDLPRATLQSGRRRRALVNRNTLVRELPWVNGVKTGFTQGAGYVLVGSATRRGVTVVSAVLGTDSEAARDADTRALLRFGLRAFRPQTAVRDGAVLARVPLAARDERVALRATRVVRRVVPRDRPMRVRVTGLPAELDGPLPRGTRVGVAEVRQGERLLARVPLETAAPVDEAGPLLRARDALGGALPAVLLVVALAAGSLPVVALRRRARRRRRRTRRERRLA